MKQSRTRLTTAVGHNFSNYSLLELALTHRSCGAQNNERLEFLGDAVLDLLISEILFKQFPNASEGDLTRLRSNLVKGETLAKVAKELGLGQYLKLGGGEQKSGGHRRQSILADTLEAILGAIYLDAGLEQCRECLLLWLGSRINLESPEQQKDPKTLLQEYLQGRKETLPIYEVQHVTGEAHEQLFTVSCTVEMLGESLLAEGMSRREGEKKAAQLVLDKLGVSCVGKN